MNSQTQLNSASQPEKIHIGKVILLSAGHFVNDSYNGFVAPLLPLLMVKLDLSLTLAGLLTTVQSISTSLSQPLFGHFTDKMRTPYFVYLGPLITALFLSSIGLCPTYGALLIAIIGAGLGTAAFHPQAAALAGVASGNRRGLGMSVFVTGGSAGYSLGPMIILLIVTSLGLGKTYIAVIPGIVISLLLFRAASRLQYEPQKTHTFDLDIHSFKRYSVLALLLVIVIVRGFVIGGFSTFIPIFLKEKGVPLILAGSALTVFQFSGALGALSGGGISDRFGRKSVILASIAFAMPMFLLFLFQTGFLSFIFLSLAGIIFFSSIPVNIIMAQELFPEKAGTVSSLIMGVGWGIAGMLVTPLGALADAVGVERALFLLAFVCVLGLVAALLLPSSNSQLPIKKSI